MSQGSLHEIAQNTLGLLPGVAKTLDEDTLCKLSVIGRLNFVPVLERLLDDYPNYSYDQLNEMVLEVKRFFALSVFDPNTGHVVSGKIDVVWHFFILHSREYSKFCEIVYGTYLDHHPILQSQKARLHPAYLETKKFYANYFGPVPINLGGEDDMVCTCGCKDVTRGSQAFEDEILVLN